MDDPSHVQRIGRYEVVRKIATGGMAELFLARYTGPGGFEKRCALKRILPQFAADQTFTRMFLTEAKITAQLDHPNIVQIFELGQDSNGQYFIAMEMVNGLNLRQLLTMARDRGQAIPAELAAYIATQALEGLAYAHELTSPDGERLNLVHRDISPQNILVSYEGAVKLVDFGIVKGSSISGETRTGMLKGKVAYMSPEQASGEPIDGRSDLFSLAVVLFELVAGERPFAGVNDLMMLKAILDQPPRSLVERAPECPEGIERAIFRGLAKYPQERFPDARAFQLELDHVLRACPIPLGRPIVAEYLQSLTEGSTVAFDAHRLRIPRRATAGFAPHLGGAHAPDPVLESADSTEASVPPAGLGVVPPTDEISVRGSAEPLREGSGSLGASNPGRDDWGQAEAEDWNGRPAARTFQEAGPAETELDRADLAAAGVRPKAWLPIAAVMAAVAVWVIAWAWMRSDVDAVIVSPAEPPSRIETVEASNGPPVPAPIPGLGADGSKTRPDASAKSPSPARVERRVSKRPAPKPPRPPTKPRASAKPKVKTGRLAVTSEPAGLQVRIKGSRQLGRTPLATDLPLGAHTLLLTSKKDGIRRTIDVRVDERNGARAHITVDKGTFQVLSRPWAEVFLNGRAIGKTPLTVEAYVGRHQLRLVSGDGAERIQRVTVKAGSNPMVRVIF